MTWINCILPDPVWCRMRKSEFLWRVCVEGRERGDDSVMLKGASSFYYLRNLKTNEDSLTTRKPDPILFKCSFVWYCTFQLITTQQPFWTLLPRFSLYLSKYPYNVFSVMLTSLVTFKIPTLNFLFLLSLFYNRHILIIPKVEYL